MTPEQVVQLQLEAYNACDVAAFAATYAENVRITDETGKLICDGVKQLREVYGPLFNANPLQAAIIENRIAAGPYVIDDETVIGRADGKTRHAVAIYKVEGDKIVSVVLVRR
ncbi:hypothetical protein PLCT1_01163 [Planctomycetaceae bacterium]|nr:hypothetical protein PLCT1_01163 [Planctomycetaceae bacterium]